jgi:hypothetical protein
VYQRVRDGEAGWERELDRYGVELVLLRYTSPGEARQQGGRDNLRQVLAWSPAWALVGFGDTGEIFVRRRGTNADAAARLAIDGVDPDRGAFLVAPDRAAPGLLRAVDAGLADVRVLTLAAIAVATAGDTAAAEQLLGRAEAQHPGDPRVEQARAVIAAVAQQGRP